MVEKYYNEQGEVAVLYSPGYGAGWYSWNREYPGILFDKDLVQLILDNNLDKFRSLAKEKYPTIYVSDSETYEIEWMEPGTLFNIEEYDGSESIEYCYGKQWFTA